MVKVSIVVPIYNTLKEYLDECINSLINQTYSNIEIILVDDGSKKETADICDSYKAIDDRIMVIHKKNEGVSVARNTGISNATGEWIIFVDSDDWIEKDAIESYIEKSNGCDIIISRGYFRTKDAELQIMGDNYKNCIINGRNEEKIKQILLKKISASTCLKMYNRNFLLKNEIFFSERLAIGEDLIFNLIAFSKYKRIAFIENITYNYRINDFSATQSYNPNTFNHVNNLIEEFEKNNLLNNIKNKYLEEFYWFVIWHLNYALIRCEFHSQNSNSYLKKIEVAKHTSKKPMYKEAIQNISLKELSSRKKALVILLRIRLYFLIYFLYKV